MKNFAVAETIRHYGENQWANDSDAFRHTYFAALLSYEFGTSFALELTTAHEAYTEDPLDKKMDLHNNSRGIALYDVWNSDFKSNNEEEHWTNLSDFITHCVSFGDIYNILKFDSTTNPTKLIYTSIGIPNQELFELPYTKVTITQHDYNYEQQYFYYEKSLPITINDCTEIFGMGIKKGITVITGGGYSGKTTLLEAIEMGVYNHEYGDGREYCITDDTAIKICAEDGRYVANTDISSFYKYIPSSEGIYNFSSLDASGSISQAVNIIEAINCESKLILIDEDRSATNFMMRDYNMHLVVKNDPIIPFTNRIKEIYNEYDVSTILVIGSSSVYLNYAECVILLEDYAPKDISNFVKTLALPKTLEEPQKTNFISKRKITNILSKEMFNYFNFIANDKSKKIVIDEYQADITFISTLISDNQINYLAYIIQLILSRSEFCGGDIIDSIMYKNIKMFDESIQQIISQYNFKCDIWFDDIRKQDIICCINRLRGIHFEFIN